MPAPNIQVILDCEAVEVAAGATVAAALGNRPPGCTRISVRGERRAPVCGMGICQECRVLVEGRVCLACQTMCRDGMRVETGVNQERR